MALQSRLLKQHSADDCQPGVNIRVFWAFLQDRREVWTDNLATRCGRSVTADSARIFRGSVPVDSKALRNRIRFFALCGETGNFLAQFNREPRSTDFDALGLGAGHGRLRAVADLLRLHLCQGRQQGGQNVAHQFVIGSEVRFGVGVEGDALGGQRSGWI